MKKKEFVVFILIFIVLFSSSFITAQNQTIGDEKINNAYSCLEDKIQERTCNSLSLEEKVFSLLSTGKCSSELISQSAGGECWPSSDCNVKDTALSVFALSNFNQDTEEAESWLSDRKTIPQDMDWYLQIETNQEAECTVFYDSNEYTVNVNEDKTLSGDAGSCLDVSSNQYWLEVSSSKQLNCYDKEFEISCNQNFLTNLLFKKSGSDTIHVSGKTTSASAGGATSETVNSFCFADSDSALCDYEASLWTTLVLDSLDYEIKQYLPYLIAMADESENEKYLPEAFLYFLTSDSDYYKKLLSKQKLSKYWQESGDRLYDTALALYPFQYETLEEKTNSKEWLLEVQDNDGCWEGNIRNTGFLLYSIWPKGISLDDSELDCADGGYYCVSGAECLNQGGDILSGYECSAGFKCCTLPGEGESCEDLNGELCSSNEYCSGEEISANDGLCCLDSCEIISGNGGESTECEINDGICRSSCYSGERETSYDCNSGEICCVEDFSSETDSGKNYTWIIVLSILIILVILGIIFRDKLRRLLFRIKSKFRKGGSGSSAPRRPPGRPPRAPPGRPAPLTGHPRKMPRPLPKKHSRAQKSRLKSQHELDGVLKKLKEMGK